MPKTSTLYLVDLRSRAAAPRRARTATPETAEGTRGATGVARTVAAVSAVVEHTN
jgi:hypothetical protein